MDEAKFNSLSEGEKQEFVKALKALTTSLKPDQVDFKGSKKALDDMMQKSGDLTTQLARDGIPEEAIMKLVKSFQRNYECQVEEFGEEPTITGYTVKLYMQAYLQKQDEMKKGEGKLWVTDVTCAYVEATNKS